MHATVPASTAPRLVEHEGAYSILLQSAFEQICDPQDWKGPINALVPWEAANIYVQAVEFMTGTKPTCVMTIKGLREYARITSIGYRMGQAGG